MKYKIIDIEETDAWFNEKAYFIGETCLFEHDYIIERGDGWVTGQFYCDNGRLGCPFFSSVKVERVKENVK